MIAGIDTGNGYVKGCIDGTILRFPSVTAVNFGRMTVPTPDDQLEEFFSRSIFNELDASFDSSMVVNKSRRLFGSRALSSGMPIEEFDVNSTKSRAEADLSAVLVLGTLAGYALVNYWNENRSLPSDILRIKCDYFLTGLPVAECRNFRYEYAQRYMAQKHMVTIHNFEQPVRIEIEFGAVQVMSEGEAAGYAMLFSDDSVMQSFLNSARKDGQPLTGISVKDLKEANSTIGLDIGEGTVNIVVFTNRRFNYDISTSYPKGYSQVLLAVLERLRDEGYHFKDRKELAEFMSREPSALQRGHYDYIRTILEQEIALFASELGTQVSRIMAQAGGFVEVMFVYGGGAIPMKDALYPELMRLTETGVQGQTTFPVLYLTDENAQFMNEMGLYMVAEAMAANAAQNKQQNL